jgi:hypothetical protein
VLVTDLETGIEGIERVFLAAGMGCGVGMFRKRNGEVVRTSGGVEAGTTWALVSFLLLLLLLVSLGALWLVMKSLSAGRGFSGFSSRL